MKRPPRPEELRLWGMVADTVRARPGDKPLKLRAKVKIKPVKAPKAAKVQPTHLASIAPLRIDPSEIRPAPVRTPKSAPGHIEPNRRKRLIKEHEAILAEGMRVDNHMMFFWQLVNVELWLQGVDALPA